MKKMKRRGLRAEEIRIDYIGLNALHLGVADMSAEKVRDANEVVLRIAIRTLTEQERRRSSRRSRRCSSTARRAPASSAAGLHVQEVIGLCRP